MRKKILLANGRFPTPFYIGGDSSSMDTVLNFLVENKNYECLSFGVYNPNIDLKMHDLERFFDDSFANRHDLFHKKKYFFLDLYLRKFFPRFLIRKKYFCKTNYTCVATSLTYFEKDLEKLIKDYHPDLILTQLEKSQSVLSIASKFKIPSLLFLTDAEIRNKNYIQAANENMSCKGIIFNSFFTKNIFWNFCKKPVYVYHHPLLTSEYNVKQNSKKYITIINPIKIKGGDIFIKIASSLKNRSFLAVEGWYNPNLDGIFLNLQNIKFLNKQLSMKKIYAQTKVLLVPSLWQESFGRVVIEAQSSGIPVIASKIGGLPESVGAGGILIEDPYNIDLWVKSINRLESKNFYNKLSSKAIDNSKKFDIANNNDLVKIIDKILSNENSNFV